MTTIMPPRYILPNPHTFAGDSSFLRFLYNAMCGNDQCVCLCIPKGKETVAVAVIQRAKLPDVGVFQLFEELFVHNPQLNLLVVVGYFLLHFDGKDLTKAKASSIKTTCIWCIAITLILLFGCKVTALFPIYAIFLDNLNYCPHF